MTPRYTSAMLRRELNLRSRELAHAGNLLHDLSVGDDPVVLFGRDPSGTHGNFHPASWSAICANPGWARRLNKVHTAWHRSRALANFPWKELDSSNSSDALLMNIFCHPGVFNGSALAAPVAALLGVPITAQPCFGVTPRIPLHPNSKGRSQTDRTEIDLQLSDLFVEAKLTETGFQSARSGLLSRYRDLEAVFDLTRLPRSAVTEAVSVDIYPDDEATYDEGTPIPTSSPGTVPLRATTRSVALEHQPFLGYQLIRNVLAAFAGDVSFCLLTDARRHDLIETWYAILSAVHHPGFTWRLKLLTWQELSAVLPPELQEFLDIKYGISPE